MASNLEAMASKLGVNYVFHSNLSSLLGPNKQENEHSVLA